MSKKIVGVTACTTGIAHTYMSAESIEKAAKELGYEVKIETDGQSGAENVLTEQEIKEAEFVICAVDTKTEMSRFNGKKVYQTTTSAVIKDALAELKKAQNAPVYVSQEANVNGPKKQGVYASLMNGVSNMIPFVVGGGILIAISFFWGINSASTDSEQFNQIAAWIKQVGDASFSLMVPVLSGYIAYAIGDRPALAPGFVGGLLAYNGGAGFLGALVAGFLAGYLINFLKKALGSVPKSLDGLKPVLIYPLISIFVVGILMVAIINPVMSKINVWISNWLANLGTGNKVLLGFVLGAMLAIDLGGPINKPSYAFGVVMLSESNYEVMAAVMASGMVPAIGIGVAALIWKKKFTQEQREEAKASIILGLSFICEGAIPYAAADPTTVIPSLVAGAGVGGALSMILGVGCPAPHGGIFITPLVQNIPGFFIAILGGVAVTVLMIRILKKDVTE